MFTGIVECVGRVTAVERKGGLARLEISAADLCPGLRRGDSVAVNGACLTVVEVGSERLAFEAVPETLERTSLGRLEAGSRVNLERALRADARLDGHIVQGHVDGTGRVRELARAGEDVRLAVDCEAEVHDYLVPKGSVAVEGVSLTVAAVDAAGFEVALIPHTLTATTLGACGPGDRVNLEADVLGKYVKRYLDRVAPSALGRGGTR